MNNTQISHTELKYVTRNGKVVHYRTKQAKHALTACMKLLAIHTGDAWYKAYDDLNKSSYRAEYRELVGLPALLTMEEKAIQARNAYGQFV